MKFRYFIPLLLSAFVCACGDSDPRIEGIVSNADKELLTLEKSDYNGRWIVIDSTRTNSEGKFRINIPRQPASEIMRLCMDGKYVYFPVDSTEKISLATSRSGFDRDFTLSGSEPAERMAAFDKALISFGNYDNPEDLSAFKRSLYSRFIQPAPTSVVAYYILTKTRNGHPLFDTDNRQDLRYFSAVATAYSQLKPDDPRTKLLEQVALNCMRDHNSRAGRTNIVNAQQTSLIDIRLTDEENRTVALSDVVKNGKPTILFFSLMNQPQSPGYNVQMREIDNSTSQRFNIYHISFDTDMFAWREAARNLPWFTVIDPTANDSRVLQSYNVHRLPAFFILNSNGEICERADSFDQLRALISKY